MQVLTDEELAAEWAKNLGISSPLANAFGFKSGPVQRAPNPIGPQRTGMPKVESGKTKQAADPRCGPRRWEGNER